MNPSRIRTWAARPAVLATLSALCLAGLLATGLVVASAVESRTQPVDGEAGPAADSDGVDEQTDGAAGTGGNGDDSAAVALNTRDGSEVYALRLKVVLVRGDTVDATNAAVAVASCSDCQTVAISLEGVLITGDAEVIAPENIALALNTECDGCRTLAYAYQNVQTTDGMVRITGEGRKRIGELRRELNGLRTAGLDLEQIRQRVSAIASAFAEVLETQVVPVGPVDAPGEAGAAGEAGASPSPGASPSGSPTPTPTASTSPAATSSASPSPSAPASSSSTTSPSSSTTPSPSASGTPSPSPTASTSPAP